MGLLYFFFNPYLCPFHNVYYLWYYIVMYVYSIYHVYSTIKFFPSFNCFLVFLKMLVSLMKDHLSWETIFGLTEGAALKTGTTVSQSVALYNITLQSIYTSFSNITNCTLVTHVHTHDTGTVIWYRCSQDTNTWHCPALNVPAKIVFRTESRYFRAVSQIPTSTQTTNVTAEQVKFCTSVRVWQWILVWLI